MSWPRFAWNSDFMPHPAAAMRHVVQLLLLLIAPLAYGADYGREQKWADQITPSIVVGDPVFLEARGQPQVSHHLYRGAQCQRGLVIVHGIGVHPDRGLIGRLRSALADHGYTTLSVQMPVLAQVTPNSINLASPPASFTITGNGFATSGSACPW